jgi:RNA polymerase sigma factor (sigma-70 family)
MEASALTQASRSGLLVRRSPLLRLQRDERLVELIREHHDRAFEVLFDRYHSRLLAFCRGILGSAEDAEDVLQDVFVNAHAAMLADSRPLNVRPWLYRIARNRCLNHLRRPAAEGTDSIEAHPAANGASTLERVQRREELRAIFSDVGELPETQRTALVLREIDDLSYEEIAQAMGTTLGAVKSLLVRARMALAEASEGRVLDCGEVRLHLAEAAEGLRKVDGPTRYHVRKCAGCRRYRTELRSTTRALAALVPLAPLWAAWKALLARVFGGSGSSSSAGASGAGGGTATGTGAGVGAGGASGVGAGGAGVAGAGVGSGAGAAGAGIGGAGATAGTGAAATASAGAAGGGLAAGGLGGGLGGLGGAGGVLGAAGAKAATGLATAALLTAGAVGVKHEITNHSTHEAPPPARTATAADQAPADHQAPPPPTTASAPATDSTASPPASQTPPAPPTQTAPSAPTSPTSPTDQAPTTPPTTQSDPASSPNDQSTTAPDPQPETASTSPSGAGNDDGAVTTPVSGQGGAGQSSIGQSVPVVIADPVSATQPIPQPAPDPPAVTSPPVDPSPLPPSTDPSPAPTPPPSNQLSPAG